MFKQKFSEDGDASMGDEKIVLDRAAFRALASDTRVEILKELDKRRKTLTELSDSVGLAVATVKEHMSSLTSSGLVEVKDEGRKWKYYELTGKGKAILYPERKKIWVMIAALLFTVLLSGYMTFYDMGYLGGRDVPPPSIAGISARTTGAEEADMPPIEDDMGMMAMPEDDPPDPEVPVEEPEEGILSLPLFRYAAYLAILLIVSNILMLGMRHSRRIRENRPRRPRKH